MMPHLMVIGGSGMLRGVVLEFAGRGWDVSVVGRRAAPLAELAGAAAGLPGRIVPLRTDYSCLEPFVAALRERCVELGSPSVIVAWIHKTAPDAPRRAAEELVAASDGGTIDFLHVLSRLRTRDPRDLSVPSPHPDHGALADLPGVSYRRAVLGWIVEPSGPRWLTHREIAAGVIDALDSGAAVTPIGQVEPIESSPAG
jgi:NAD(P)-dependent dehydrogenase (short-subunit alcohol dehydrogenase family)